MGRSVERIGEMSISQPTIILEEEIFTAGNLDPDCSTIGRLLYEYGERFILSARLWRIASTQSRYGTTSGC